MADVEQAIFTSAETSRASGYQVASQSPGVCEEDVRELAVWGPSHDALLDLDPDASSINFHPLPSGAWCVSRTTPAGWEYSGRGGQRVYTQSLIVPPEVLARFANNPFSLIRAAEASGLMEVFDEVPPSLPPVQLPGGASAVDQNLLARLATRPGAGEMAKLVQAALDASCLAVAGRPSAAELIAGLLSCLPVECRLEFPFSTGLKFSSRRPFRLMALSGDAAEQRWVAHHSSVTIFDFNAEAALGAAPLDGWARLIERVLASGRTSFLAAGLAEPAGGLTAADLPALGLQLLEEFDVSGSRRGYRPEPAGAPGEPASCPPESSPGRTRAHGAHHRFEKSGAAAALLDDQLREAAPSRQLDPISPELIETLEHLDDLVYEAIGGKTAALDELRLAWPELVEEWGDDLLAESRQQYLRYALTIWQRCLDCEGVRNPARAMQALEVLCLLFTDA